jgi:uncharacterized membrane protein
MTTTGRWALRLDLGGLVLVVLSVLVVALADVRAFGVLAFAGLLVIVAGGALALLAAIRDGERSRLVFVGVVPALFALFLVIGELTVTH